MDRVDMNIFVPEVESDQLNSYQSQDLTTSKTVREKVIKARKIQTLRFAQTPYTTNSQLSSQDVKSICQLTTQADFLLKRANSKIKLSARGFFKTIKVAQTIADLENSPKIDRQHLAEALQYRQSHKSNK